MFTIRELTSRQAEPPAASQSEDTDGLFLGLDVEAQITQPAAAEATGTPPKACPRCGASMAINALLCVSCGYNTQTNRAHKAANARRTILGPYMRTMAARIGPFALGCVLSSAGALIGATVWSVVAIATDYEIGWLAWGLGALTGVGMAMGYRSGNLRAGVAATGIAVMGIVAAKFMAFVYINRAELLEVRNTINTLGDEQHTKRFRIAGHRAEKQAQQQGLAYDDPAREHLFDAELDEIMNWSPQQLDEAVASLEAWEAGGKWKDPAYARNFLIDEIVNEAVEQYFTQFNDSDDEYREMSAAERRRAYDDAVAQVDALSTAEQLQKAQRIEHERDREAKCMRLAWHFAELQAMSLGFPYGDEQWLAIEEKELEQFKQHSDQELNDEIKKIEHWENSGKWDDSGYVRDHLIYARVDEAMQAWDESTEPGSEEQREQAWRRHHADAVEHVDAMPAYKRLREAKQLEAQEKRQIEDSLDDLKGRVARETASEALSFFVKNCFGTFDILFVLLAVGSAFKIAVGGGIDDE